MVVSSRPARQGRHHSLDRHRFQCPLELATSGIDITSSRTPDKSRHTRSLEDFPELLHWLFLRSLKCDPWTRIPCNKVYFGSYSTYQFYEIAGVRL